MAQRRGRFRSINRNLVGKEAPALPATEIKQTFDIFSELGASGLKRSAGYVSEEMKRELQGQQGARVYRELVDNSAIVGAALYAMKSIIRKAEWEWESPDAAEEQNTEEGTGEPEVDEEGSPIEPEPEADEKPAPFAEDDPAKKIRKRWRHRAIRKGQPDPAEFMEQCFQDMSMSWPDTLAEILTMIEYGYSPLEVTYKTREGTENLAEKPGESSRYDDGLIGIRKIALRAQETIQEWIFDERGGIQGLVQQAAPNYMRVEIPIAKLLLFRTTTEKNNPEGRSMLRSAYFDWYFYKRLVEVSAIGAERDLAGLPVARIPSEKLLSDTDAVTVAYRQMVESIRVDEQAGVVIPSDKDDKGNTLYDIELLQGGGAKAFDIKALIERHESRIAMVLSAAWLMLGQQEVGARSLGETQMDTFTMTLESLMDSIADVVNRHLVPRLFALNGWPLDKLPVLKHGSVSKSDVQAAVEALKGLSAAGADIFPDEKLIQHFYSLLDWPTEGREEALAFAEQERERMAEALQSGTAQVNPLTGEPMPAKEPGAEKPGEGKPPFGGSK